MSQIVAHDEVAPTRNTKELAGGHQSWRTYFIKPERDRRDGEPNAFLAESTPGRILRTHFHEVDQWQVAVKGGGTLGRHKLERYAVHFSRAYTPYGPIVNGEGGLGFLTLRHHWDAGAQTLPEAQEKLMRVTEREPWQVTELPDFSGDAEVNLHPFSQVRDDRGLAAYALALKPGAATTAPSPADSGGQFIVVLEGALLRDGKRYADLAVASVRPDEAALQLQAGPQGLKALVLNFPRQKQAPQAEEAATPAGAAPGERVWQCLLCAFVYDEAEGLPEEGIPPGTPWEQVPDSWSCPDCSATKAEFEMIEI